MAQNWKSLLPNSKTFLISYMHPKFGELRGYVSKETQERIIAKDQQALNDFVSQMLHQKKMMDKLDSTQNDAANNPCTSTTMSTALPDTKMTKVTQWKKDHALLLAYQSAIGRSEGAKQKQWSWTQVASSYRDVVSEPMTAEGARLKIRSLRNKYDRLVKHNDKTGIDPVDIDEELENAFGKQHSITVATLENNITSTESNNENASNSMNEESATPPASRSKKRGHPTSMNSGDDQDDAQSASSTKKSKTIKGKVCDRKTGAEIVMSQMRAMREEDRKIQSEQFEIRCQLGRDMISAIRDLKN